MMADHFAGGWAVSRQIPRMLSQSLRVLMLGFLTHQVRTSAGIPLWELPTAPIQDVGRILEPALVTKAHCQGMGLAIYRSIVENLDHPLSTPPGPGTALYIAAYFGLSRRAPDDAEGP
jgi:hypothetical protein